MSLYHFIHVDKLGSSEKISVVTVGYPSTPRCNRCIRLAGCNGGAVDLYARLESFDQIGYTLIQRFFDQHPPLTHRHHFDVEMVERLDNRGFDTRAYRAIIATCKHDARSNTDGLTCENVKVRSAKYGWAGL